MDIRPLTGDSLAAEVARLRPSEAAGREVAEVVARLVAGVQARGDAAVVEATARFDWPEANVAGLPVPLEDLETAYRESDPRLIEALETTRDNCTFFHRHELRTDWEAVGPQGQRVGMRYLPMARAGLYVPGGLGAYASTVIMNAVPAQVACVGELIICTPPGRDGSVNPSILAAAWLLGIHRVFRVGGAQAIAAMALGTETIPRVDVVCGPGNAYVMEAKRQVYGMVGIDSLAGPSEVLVVADESARPEWVAADLLAQEEHRMGASGVLMADSEGFCLAVREAVRKLKARADAPAFAQAGLEAPGTRTVGLYPAAGEPFRELAACLVDAYAPEHLELQLRDPRGFLAGVHSAGAVFVGSHTPTAFGDYVVGTNHVLPTGGAARFSSPLSVDTFVRRSSIAEMGDHTVRRLLPPLARIADSEGFSFHRISAELRAEGGADRPASAAAAPDGPV